MKENKEKTNQKEKKSKIDITKTEPIDKVKPQQPTVKNAANKNPQKAKGKNEVEFKIQKTRQVMKKYNITSVVMISLVLFICSFIISAQLNTVENTDIIKEGMREAELLTELQKAYNRYE